MRLLGHGVETIEELDKFIDENKSKLSFDNMIHLFQLRILLEIKHQLEILNKLKPIN